MKNKIVLSAVLCFIAASVFAAYIYTDDDAKKAAASDTNQQTQAEQKQRGGSGLQFGKGGKGGGTANPANKTGSSATRGFAGGGGYGITGGVIADTGTCTPCAGCPSGQSSTGNGCQEDSGGCCAAKTPCAATCPRGQNRTANAYAEDSGGCCATSGVPAACVSPKVNVNGVCKTPCKPNRCLAGYVRNTRVIYAEDGDCCVCQGSSSNAKCRQIAAE
ncbi:MAG: hypothetical protein LBI01_01440 [Elusimicrobium sp.]|jgi:hypothetical protein|nr:hypothetical protein [Elusimicrobium sp.]